MSGRRRWQLGRMTAAEWTAANEVLLDGEFGFETDMLGLKVGNGTDVWEDLPYINGDGGPGSSNADIDTFLGLADTPDDYTGDASKFVKVKSDETGLEFVTGTGGGGSTSVGTYASLPAAGNDGNLYLCTDSPYFLRDNGATWDHFINGIKVVPPVSGDFAWINQGSATIATTSGGVYLLAPAAAGNDIKLRKKSATAAYTIEAGFYVNFPLFDFCQVGITFRQSSDGKLHAFNAQAVSGFLRLQSTKYDNATSFNAHYSIAANWPGGALVFFQISDDNSNRICRFSTDNKNWIQYHSIGRTDFLTADEVGFFANAAQATYDTGIHLIHWRQF
jgi:major tropism determinant Mtd-like protein